MKKYFIWAALMATVYGISAVSSKFRELVIGGFIIVFILAVLALIGYLLQKLQFRQSSKKRA